MDFLDVSEVSWLEPDEEELQAMARLQEWQESSTAILRESTAQQ